MAGCRRRPEPGEDFEDFVSSPTRSHSEPQLRPSTRQIASPRIPGLQRACDRFSPCVRDEEESPSQALSAMVERLYDEELRKREERRLARTMEREQEFARQAPFAPRIRAPRRSRNDKVERHLILYDKHLEMVQKRRVLQEQKLRDEQEYLELHSVHRAQSPGSQAYDAAVYQRLHEEAEIKRQRLEEREKAAKTPSSPTRASSMTNMRLFHMASEAAEKRQKLQERKLKEESEYLQMHSVHRASSPQADPSRISQRLHEEAELKKQRLYDRQREKVLKDNQLFASRSTAKGSKILDPKSLVERLYAPEPRKKSREEEEKWLRERQERRPVPRRAVSHGPFRRLEPGDSPKAITESPATRVPGSVHQVTAKEAEDTAEAATGTDGSAEPESGRVEEESSVPTAEQIKAFCQSTEELVQKPTVELVSTVVSPSVQVANADVKAEEESMSMPTADQIKAFCESTQVLVESTKADVQGRVTSPPEGTNSTARRISLELDECF